jgi:AP endonuclease-1
VAAASPKKAAPKKAPAKRKASPPTAEAPEQPEPGAPAASPSKKKAKAAATAEASDVPDEAAATPRKKKGKAAADPDAERHPSAPLGGAALDTLAAEGLPRNADMPQELSYAPRPKGQIRIASWNITSLASAEKKGMLRYLMAEDADIVVLTETKVSERCGGEG